MVNASDHLHNALGLPGLHSRLTVLPAGPHERSALSEHLARLLAQATPGAIPTALVPLDAHDLEAAARESAIDRVDEHGRFRDEMTAQLRRIREQQAVIANRRDEAAARARRLASHLADCESLLEQAGQLTSEADQAQRTLDDRRGELDDARDRLALVEDQRVAAVRAIDDAQSQLQDLESAELDETSLRRELEKAGHELREAEAAHAEATAMLEAIEARTTHRGTRREQLLVQRNELVQRVEAPLFDARPVHEALAALDAETIDEADLVAQDLAREWVEVNDELHRIESALPSPPSEDQLTTAEHNLNELQQLIAELEATTSHSRLHPAIRDQIESAHEAVLAAEEYLDQSGGHPQADAQLEAARVAEQQILASYGYETYLDLVIAEPEPGEAQSELLDALRARRQAEDTLASLWAATEPPQIVVTLRARRERIFREAADLLCCDPEDNVAELLYNQPVVPPNRTRDLANSLASYGIYPVGVSVRDAAIEFLLDVENEVTRRDEWVREVEQIDDEMTGLDDEDGDERQRLHGLYATIDGSTQMLDGATERVQTLERELVDRTSRDERRMQRVAAAEQLRAQVAAVGEALKRSEDEYHEGLAQAEAAATAAEATLERANAALSDAVRKLRRIGEALPPALRPKPSDDPLGDLPRLRETLAGEVERAEVALTNASQDLERARGDIDETQDSLDSHLTTTPDPSVQPDDMRAAVRRLVERDDVPLAVLDDPFDDMDDDERMDLLDILAASASRRPVVLLTDHLDTLGWAISLPDDVGTVTGLPTEQPEHYDELPLPALTNPSGAVAPST